MWKHGMGDPGVRQTCVEHGGGAAYKGIKAYKNTAKTPI
jgi:hypothetical protein